MAAESAIVEMKLRELREWFADNPKLPKEIDPILLKRFLKCMFGDVEQTKELILLNFHLRNKHANLFLKRDPEDEPTQKSFGVVDLVTLPGLTPEGHKILLHHMEDTDPSKMNSTEECKLFFLITDSHFTLPDLAADDERNGELMDNLASGEIQVVDIGGYTMSHVARISIFVFRTYMKFLQEAYPLRLKGMHIINCPPFLNKMVAFIKPFINDEVFKMITFHTNGIETLYEHVPKDMLPEEYGGKAGSIKDLKAKTLATIRKKREYLMDEKQWKIEPTGETKNRWYFF